MNDQLRALRTETSDGQVSIDAMLEAYTVVWGFYDEGTRWSATVWSTSPAGAAEAVRVRHRHSAPGPAVEIVGVVELRTVT